VAFLDAKVSVELVAVVTGVKKVMLVKVVAVVWLLDLKDSR